MKTETMTARRAARQRRRRRRLMLGTAVALTSAGVLAALVLALLPDHRADAGTAVTARAIPRTSPEAGGPTPPGAPARTVTPTGTRTATPAHPPASPAASAAAQPSATGTSRPPRPAPTTAPAAGRIRPGTTYRGVATAYEAGDGNGACLFGPSPDLMVAAMNTTDYESSRACGAYVLVRAANGASVTVRITNECPAPCAPGQIDLSRQAFARLADLSAGRIPITWRLVSPGAVGTLSIRYKTGSSPYWCGIQAIGHRNPVAALEVRTAHGWRRLPRTGYDYFLSADGSGCGGAIRLTDIYGERLTLSGIALRPDVVQPTGVQFSRH
ncbi:expansin EXLX1 family cellulose-binding protein [Streptomyces sp. NPDC127190]|uniref:expansin EXLX1 family cellulose-binding protein n=1 Tax=unclassified Streptomyces TaxID=2593676 RepID=UPI00362CA798